MPLAQPVEALMMHHHLFRSRCAGNPGRDRPNEQLIRDAMRADLPPIRQLVGAVAIRIYRTDPQPARRCEQDLCEKSLHTDTSALLYPYSSDRASTPNE